MGECDYCVQSYPMYIILCMDFTYDVSVLFEKNRHTTKWFQSKEAAENYIKHNLPNPSDGWMFIPIDMSPFLPGNN